MRRVGVALVVAGCALRTDDLDRDGWSVLDDPPDCDDGDPSRHPLRPEVTLDGIDQDCNGVDLIMWAVGSTHQCELEATGSVLCDGDNTYGQLEVPTGHSFVQIACGDFHTCGLEPGGTIACWGDNRFGQATPPQSEDFVRIDADGNWSIGVRDNGALTCWGACWGPGR